MDQLGWLNNTRFWPYIKRVENKEHTDLQKKQDNFIWSKVMIYIKENYIVKSDGLSHE